MVHGSFPDTLGSGDRMSGRVAFPSGVLCRRSRPDDQWGHAAGQWRHLVVDRMRPRVVHVTGQRLICGCPWKCENGGRKVPDTDAAGKSWRG